MHTPQINNMLLIVRIMKAEQCFSECCCEVNILTLSKDLSNKPYLCSNYVFFIRYILKVESTFITYSIHVIMIMIHYDSLCSNSTLFNKINSVTEICSLIRFLYKHQYQNHLLFGSEKLF